MHKHCVVGAGIVGRYAASQLPADNLLLMSGRHPQFEGPANYPIGEYLGRESTWQEKAAGIISFPSKHDIEKFPFSARQYQRYSRQLIAELGLASMAPLAENPTIRPAVQALQELFPDQPMQFFWSGHSQPLGPSFAERAQYGQYWLSHKPAWSFLERSTAPAALQAQYFTVARGKATALVAKDPEGNIVRVDAKHFVLACHTPGTINILRQTWEHNHMKGADMIGRYYADHPQTSLGVLLPHVDIPRTTLPAICYQDREYHSIPYRLEFHFTPPRGNLVAKTRERLPQYTDEDFVRHFVRLAIVYHIPPRKEHKLSVGGTKVELSDSFGKECEDLRQLILPHVKSFLAGSRAVILNGHEHNPFYFAAHLTGGISYPHMVDEHFRLREIPNVSVAGCGIFPTSGLFNPVFQSLLCAKHACQ